MLNVFLLLSLVQCSIGGNILFVSLLESPSHHIWNEALVDGLLSKGHNITMISHYHAKIQNSNYTVVYVGDKSYMDTIDNMDVWLEIIEESTLLAVVSLWSSVADMCTRIFTSEELRKVLTFPKDFFDLIIFDVTFSHCFLPFIDYFGKPPVVGVTAFGMQPYTSAMIGNRIDNYVPYYSLPYTARMTFFQRFNNILHQTLERLCIWYFIRDATEVAKNYFGQDILPVNEYEKYISLIFSNDDPVLMTPRPFPPNVIPVGGIHVRKPKKLDDDLQKVMDEATNGVIFVSMGSNFESKYYGEHAKTAFVEAFSRLNLTVLWKFDGIDAPKNVVLGKWFSQTDVLAHPNTKLFITHCGALSTQETVIRGVPIVGIPLFADQHNNGAKVQSINGGVILKYADLTADMVYNAIMEVLSNPEYKQNMLKLSNLYQSQPQQPLEKFLVWMEYVLKNGHLDHLSVEARNMTWYQADNWDIFGFCLLSVAVIYHILRKLCCKVKKIFVNNTVVKKQKIN